MNIPFLNFRDPAECQYKRVFATTSTSTAGFKYQVTMLVFNAWLDSAMKTPIQ